MTSNKQVSPVIRISRGERDASARATHLEAATGKFLVTTNERKQMSTKTNFKRIALVAVAALGMGVLSSAPSQATFLVTPTLAVTAATPTKVKADSTNAGTLTVSFNTDTAGDSVVLTSSNLTRPADATNPAGLNVFFGDTVGSSAAAGLTTPTSRKLTSGDAGTSGTAGKLIPERGDSLTMSAGDAVIITGVVGQNVMKLLPQLDTTTGTSARYSGTYTFLISATPYSGGVKGTPVTTTFTVTIAALDSESTVASAGTSKAFLSSSTSAPTEDASINAVATASTTIRGYVYVNLLNASSVQAGESVTITTTIGSIGAHGDTSPIGKNVTLRYNSGPNYYPIFSDGTAGTAVITVKSTSVTFANKSVNFYAAQPSSIVARALNTSPGVGTTSPAVEVVAKDVNGLIWSGTLALYSDTVGTISDTATAAGTRPANCSYTPSVSAHLCSVTGVVAGTAKVKAYTSAQTVVSNEVSLTVTSASAATVKLAWNKASYAPGEKATLSVSVLDSTGKPVAASTFANLFAAGGISLSTASGNGSDTLTAISVLTSTPAADYVGTSTDTQKLYTVYMPAAGGTLVASATGGSSLPVAGQVKVSASATVTDSGAAALAAVNALATTVASLRTLITTLTNLVLKIQKKVKA
jgi:hypothetical protein